jgi:PAS domain S-box-containing protein
MVYPLLQKYARFLNDHYLDEFTRLTLQRAQDVQLPLLQLFHHLSHEQLFAYSLTSNQALLASLCDGVAEEAHLDTLQRWKNNQLQEVPSQSVDARDVAFTFHTRKYAFYQLLVRYTQDLAIYQTLVGEIELFYSQCLMSSLAAFMEVQQRVLQREKDRLQTVLDTTEEGMVALDSRQRVTLWNRALEERTGVKREALLGQPIFDFFPLNAVGEEKQAVLRALQGESVYLQELPIQSREGYYDLHVVPLRDSTGTIAGTLSVSRDVTQSRKASQAIQAQHEEIQAQQEELKVANEELHEQLSRLEEIGEALSQSESRLREAQSIARLGHYHYNVNQKHLLWSEEMQRIFGRHPSFEEMLGEGYYALIHPMDQPAARQEFERAMRQGDDFSLEHRLMRPDGTLRWVLLQGRAYTNQSGQLERMDGTCLDITERKEAQLRVESERYFIQRLTDTSPDVITLYDLEKGANLYSSREIFSILGYSPQELAQIVSRGQSAFVEYFHPDDLATIFSFLESYKTYRSDTPRQMEYRIRHANGEWVWINDRYNVFSRNEEGLPTQIIGVARDVTVSKRAENEIALKNEQLQQANEEMAALQEEMRQTNEELSRVNIELESRIEQRTRELAQALDESRRQNQLLLRTNTDLDNFVYTASHDLKSPIANLEGFATLLSQRLADRLDEKEAHMLGTIHAMTNRLKATISDLTDISRLQQDEAALAEPLSFADMLSDVLSDLQGLLEASGATIRTDWMEPRLSYPRKNLRSIIYNLVSNALKYRSFDRPVVIELRTFWQGDKLVLCVSDNGLGISASQLPKLFGMFKRLHSHVEGSGIGLYIIKRMIENQGGRIEVESEEGKGTTFRVYFRNP